MYVSYETYLIQAFQLHKLKVLFSLWQKEKAEVIQTSLFVAGLNTLLQTWFGTRLPVVIGSSYAFIAPALYIVLSDRYSGYVDPQEVRLVNKLDLIPVVF